MLVSLDIRDMLIIDRLELGFRPGLNVLTGETGAGKSILLDSLGFVLGWRGRADLVRAGAEQGEVTAVFEIAPDHPANAVLSEAGIEVEDDLILRRVNRADGRKTAWINGVRASGEVLRQLSDTLVETIAQPIPVAGGVAQIGVSIGWASAPKHADTSSHLLALADQALYFAKENGRNMAVCIEDLYREQQFAREDGNTARQLAVRA